MKVCVIGTGNVGSQFANIFKSAQINPRTLEGLPGDADLYILCVSDSAVAEVASRLPKLPGIVAHTTGSVGLEALQDVDCKGYGVFYPFQTISKNRCLAPRDIPILLEANDSPALCILKECAKEYGFTSISEADSATRGKVHLAGTFACNFTNAVIGISQNILQSAGIKTEIIIPLVKETVNKLNTLTAKEAQTGPAIRKDYSTLEKHCTLLNEMGYSIEKDLYNHISSYIMDNEIN